jgi:hypothetical protein
MNTNEKQISLIKDLLTDAVELRKKIDDYPEQLAYRSGLLKTLIDIEKVLSSQPLDLDRLSKDEFGIFRMVTDNSSLEDSSIGKELLSLLKNFHLFRQVIKGQR